MNLNRSILLSGFLFRRLAARRHRLAFGSLASAPSNRRALATLAVLWAVALVSIVLVSVQGGAFREAAAGREAVARTRAYWAARAGVEAQIAKLTLNTLSPDPSSAFTLQEDLAAASRADLGRSSYIIQHTDDTQTQIDGPLDAHSLLNVNVLTPDDLLMLDSMDEGVASAINSWVAAEDTQALSNTLDSTAAMASGAYESLRYPYSPRQKPVRSLKELELITGVDPTLLRGEDANFNGLLDPGEDDADLSLPPDNADTKLDQGWARYLTAFSEQPHDAGYGLSGRKRLDLRTAPASDLATRFRVDQSQAQAMIAHAQGGGTLGDFVTTDLSALAATGTQDPTRLDGGNAVQNLTNDQLKLVLDEGAITLATPLERSGKININTISRQTLERFPQIEATLADTLISERDARSGGFVSLADLLTVPGVGRENLGALMDVMDISSNVYIVTSRGRDSATGVEVEITAVLDRSSIPVIIRNFSVR